MWYVRCLWNSPGKSFSQLYAHWQSVSKYFDKLWSCLPFGSSYDIFMSMCCFFIAFCSLITCMLLASFCSQDGIGLNFGMKIRKMV